MFSMFVFPVGRSGPVWSGHGDFPLGNLWLLIVIHVDVNGCDSTAS